MHLTKLMSVLSIQYFLVLFFTKHRYNFIIQNKEQRYFRKQHFIQATKQTSLIKNFKIRLNIVLKYDF